MVFYFDLGIVIEVRIVSKFGFIFGVIINLILFVKSDLFLEVILKEFLEIVFGELYY